MAEKNVILKDGADTLYPKTLLSLVDGMPQPTSADNGKMLGVEEGAYALVEGGGGSTLYRHLLFLKTTNSYTSNVFCEIISLESTPYTMDTLGTFLQSMGCARSNTIEGGVCYPANGLDSSQSMNITGLFLFTNTNTVYASGEFVTSGQNISYRSSSVTMFVSDTVVQIS